MFGKIYKIFYFIFLKKKKLFFKNQSYWKIGYTLNRLSQKYNKYLASKKKMYDCLIHHNVYNIYFFYGFQNSQKNKKFLRNLTKVDFVYQPMFTRFDERYDF